MATFDTVRFSISAGPNAGETSGPAAVMAVPVFLANDNRTRTLLPSGRVAIYYVGPGPKLAEMTVKVNATSAGGLYTIEEDFGKMQRELCTMTFTPRSEWPDGAGSMNIFDSMPTNYENVWVTKMTPGKRVSSPELHQRDWRISLEWYDQTEVECLE